ncbi:hypothetical protein [Actinoallomurus iriomotensis]|uniref:Uncharacterized protein n=1 Tax=Actinoallomurus iriomotensis TaxID=478107 RepID=A0A9W6VYX7_9ACTN|nr:hypothetical protein [Actinoallomurus iriomotensis]GLY84142.1 hypothetical protein Airi02_020710 [Actinoallomurus iriomotensis]
MADETRLPAPPTDAVADMRATARWTIAAAAGVGALLLGGAPLTAIGKISGPGEAALAFAGLVVALGGVGWAIWQTGEALMPRIATLDDLDAPDLADLRATIARDPSVFYGPFGESREELREAVAFHGKVAAELAAIAAGETDPVRSRVLAQALEDARGNTASARRLQARLLEFVHAWKVRTAVRRARLHTLAAAAVIALGAVLFLGATHDSGDDRAAHPAPSASPSTSR